MNLYFKKAVDSEVPNPGEAACGGKAAGEAGEPLASGGVKPGGIIGSEGAVDECGEHFSCGGVVPGGLEVQGLGKGPPGVLTCGAAERGWRHTRRT